MQKWFLVLGATKRRTKWSSIAEAGKLRQTPFFGAWHPEVWDLFVSHGLVPVEEGGEAVQLATPSWAEACVFGEPTGIAEGWDKLGKLQIPVGFLLGEKSRSMYGYAQEMVWRPPKASNEVVKDGDHLVSQPSAACLDEKEKMLIYYQVGTRRSGRGGGCSQSLSRRQIW